MRTPFRFQALRSRAGRPAAALVLGLVLAACGSGRNGGPAGSPAAVVGAATARTVEARTARVAIDGQDAAATGEVDLAARAGRFLTTPGGAVLTVEGATYVPAAGGAGGGGAPAGGAARWRRAESIEAAFPASIRSGDPFLAVDLVRGVVAIDPFGGAEVRGVSTLRYTVDVDLARAASAAPPEGAAALRRLAAASPPGRVRLDVFVDGAGRLRRVLLPSPLRTGPPPTRTDGEVRGVTIDYSDFGVPVDIGPPPPDRVD